jgi:hypothetical protein
LKQIATPQTPSPAAGENNATKQEKEFERLMKERGSGRRQITKVQDP